MIAPQRNPISRLGPIAALKHHHVFLLNGGNVIAMTSLRRHHHVHRASNLRWLLGSEPAGEHGKTADNEKRCKSGEDSVHALFSQTLDPISRTKISCRDPVRSPPILLIFKARRTR